MKRKISAIICAAVCLAAACCLTSCSSGSPTTGSTGSVWANPSSKAYSSSASSELTAQTAAELSGRMASLLEAQIKSVDKYQLQYTASLISKMEEFRGNDTACGRYISALDGAYQCIYGFYLKNSTVAKMEEYIKEVESAYSALSDDERLTVTAITGNALRRAANSFNAYGSAVGGVASAAPIFAVTDEVSSAK